MLEKQTIIYEDENVIIKKASIEVQQDIQEAIKEYKISNEEIDYTSPELMQIMFCNIVEAKNEDYNFSKYKLEDFKEIIDNVEYYPNMQTYCDLLTLELADMIMIYFRSILLQLKQTEVSLLKKEIDFELNEMKDKAKRIDDKEKKAKKKAKLKQIKKDKKKNGK